MSPYFVLPRPEVTNGQTSNHPQPVAKNLDYTGACGEVPPELSYYWSLDRHCARRQPPQISSSLQYDYISSLPSYPPTQTHTLPRLSLIYTRLWRIAAERIERKARRMAPSSSEPRQMVVVLNTARRKALYQLAGEITTYIRSQLTLQKEDDSQIGWGSYHYETAHSPAPEQGSPSASAKPAKADASVSQMHTPPSLELIALRKAALAHFDEWRKELLTKLKEILSVKDDNKVLEARQERQKKIAQARVETPARGEDLIDFVDSEMAVNSTPQDAAKAVKSLQSIYHPIPTRLTTLAVEDRREVLSAVLILLLSTGHYSAYSRSFVTYLTSAFELTLSFLIEEEKEIAKTMIEASTEAEKAKKDGTMSADAEAHERKQQNQVGRFWKVGLASVAGAALIGVTGGLAAPVVAGAIGGLMGSVGLGGLASFLGVFWMNGALVGTLFGAFGAKMTVGSRPCSF